VNLHYMPVHLQPYYRDLGFTNGQFPESEAYGESAITLPLYPSMTDEAHSEVVTALRQILAAPVASAPRQWLVRLGGTCASCCRPERRHRGNRQSPCCRSAEVL